MAFHDGLARDPKNLEEFWKTIEETFEQVEGVLTGYPVETRDEALSGKLRHSNESGSFKGSPGDIIRYRGVSVDYDSRDYFLKLGRRFLPEVDRQIKSRQFTPKFAKDWGVVMMCHGFISAHILDDSDGLMQVRAGRESGKSRSREPQRKWIARRMLPRLEDGMKRNDAEFAVGVEVQQIIDKKNFPPGFPSEWFAPIVAGRDLATTYDQKHLSNKKMRKLVTESRDDIPSIDFPRQLVRRGDR
jgi:hypothetical protein